MRSEFVPRNITVDSGYYKGLLECLRKSATTKKGKCGDYFSVIPHYNGQRPRWRMIWKPIIEGKVEDTNIS